MSFMVECSIDDSALGSAWNAGKVKDYGNGFPVT